MDADLLLRPLVHRGVQFKSLLLLLHRDRARIGVVHVYFDEAANESSASGQSFD